MDWQPIETAPQDGTPVLVWYRGQMLVAEYGAVWAPNNLKWIVPEPSTHSRDGKMRIVTEISRPEIDGRPIPNTEGPTHWHPLPEPPARAERD